MGTKKSTGMPFPIIFEIPDREKKGPGREIELDIEILIKYKLKAESLYEMFDDLIRKNYDNHDTGPRFPEVNKNPQKFIEAKPYRLRYKHETIADQQYVFKVLEKKKARVQVYWLDPILYNKMRAHIMSHL